VDWYGTPCPVEGWMFKMRCRLDSFAVVIFVVDCGSVAVVVVAVG
jgi:hypothetical protein